MSNINIQALAYMVIETTDVKAWHDFLVNIVGLMPKNEFDSQCNYYAMDEYAWRIAIQASKVDKISVAGWELSHKTSFQEACESLDANHIEYDFLSNEICKARKIQQGIRIQDPAGNDIELFYQMDLDYQKLNSAVAVPSFETGFNGSMGLGHYVIPTDNFKACVDFYRNILNFGQTDYMQFQFAPEAPEQGLHFLHVDNPRHHSLAIFEDPKPPSHGCVHLMFEVNDMDEVGYFIDRVKDAGINVTSSLGKHTNDLMTSVYVESPSGFSIEFGTGGAQHDWADYKPTVSSKPSLWGHSWQA